MIAPSATEPASIGKLPFWCTLVEAHRGLIDAGTGFWRSAVVWLLVLLVLDASINWFYWPLQEAASGGVTGIEDLSPGILIIVSSLLWIVIGGIVGVPLHRLILADRLAVTAPKGQSAPNRTYVIYILRNIAIAAIALLPIFAMVLLSAAYVDVSAAAPAANAPSTGNEVISALATADDSGAGPLGILTMLGVLVLMVPVFIVLGYLPTRFSLALPATAIDSPEQTFKHAWHASSGSFWRLFWGGLLSYWPLLVVGIVEFSATGLESQSQMQYVVTQSFGTTAGFVAGLIWVAFFSLAYRRLVPRT